MRLEVFTDSLHRDSEIERRACYEELIAWLTPARPLDVSSQARVPLSWSLGTFLGSTTHHYKAPFYLPYVLHVGFADAGNRSGVRECPGATVLYCSYRVGPLKRGAAAWRHVPAEAGAEGPGCGVARRGCGRLISGLGRLQTQQAFLDGSTVGDRSHRSLPWAMENKRLAEVTIFLCHLASSLVPNAEHGHPRHGGPHGRDDGGPAEL